jgi:hypothetical protein
MNERLVGSNTPPGVARTPRRGRLALLGLMYAACAVACLWVLLALRYLDPLPRPARLLLAGAWAVVVLVAARSRRRHRFVPTLTVAGVVAVVIVWSLHEPRLAAAPSRDQERVPRVEVAGSHVTVWNVRNAQYRSATDCDVTWETRTYNLDDLTGADFVIEPFEAMRALAHTLISFGFRDGDHLALSFETEHVPGRGYNPLRGLFHQYMLRAIAGDERDVIGLRTEIRRDDVHVYPLRTSPATLRRLFLLLLERVNALATRPEYYNTLTNNCTTQYRTVYETLSGRSLRFDPRVYLPGYTDALAVDLGLIDWTGDVGTARKHFLVNGRAPLDERARLDGRDWSRRLRTPLPDQP